MRRKSWLLGLLGVFLLATSCEEVAIEDRRQGIGGVSPDTADSLAAIACLEAALTKRSVLIEDFTGIRCGFCPPAGKEMLRLAEQYPGQVVAIGMHAGGLSAPAPPKYLFDMRTPIGDQLWTDHQMSSNPRGLVSRASWRLSSGDVRVLRWQDWAAATTQALALPQEVKLCGLASYSATSDTIKVTIAAEYLVSGGTDEFLSVYLLEDSIVGVQKDYGQTPDDLSDYAHRHVMRGSFNGTYGTRVASTIPQAGEKFVVQFKQPLSTFNRVMASEGQPLKLSIAAFVTNRSGNIMVRQAVEIPVNVTD